MPTNWKNLIEKDQRDTYTLPSGWDSRENIAEQMKCSPERSGQLLRPLVNAGKIETQTFPVFDVLTKRLVRVVAYRKIEAVKEPDDDAAPGAGASVARLAALKAAGKSYAEIGKTVGLTGEQVRGRLRVPRR